MYALRRSEDIDEARQLHAQLFPSDEWVGDDHEFWIAYDDIGTPVGFCSAIHRPATNVVFLSRAGVVREAQRVGLQRRMIRTRIAWAKRVGARGVITYVSLKNYSSLVNLLKCGFRFYTSPSDDAEDFHFLRIDF
jgi:GNAT superfamily N-acetyltransferase